MAEASERNVFLTDDPDLYRPRVVRPPADPTEAIVLDCLLGSGVTVGADGERISDGTFTTFREAPLRADLVRVGGLWKMVGISSDDEACES